MDENFKQKTKNLIDDLKNVCSNAGLSGDGNEYKIITQVFLYKFINDKFIYEIKKIDKRFTKETNLGEKLEELDKKEFKLLCLQLNENIARLDPNQLISNLYQKQNEKNFSNIFDQTLLDISKENSSIFSIITSEGQNISLFEDVSKYVSDNKDDFCRAIINKLVEFSFENIFNEKFDFFADIFEYLIKDYNTSSGQTYAEYYTPHAVSKVIANILIENKINNVTCHDPSSGSGTLLMNLSHAIGEDKCSIYSQDISQKSTYLIRLNLILNNLVHSIPNVVQGNTILSPYHRDTKEKLKKFDYIVSNPPFKTDFSKYREKLLDESNSERFFLGVPKVPKLEKEKKKMAIYFLFIQHIIHCLSKNGKAAIVIPTGFISLKSGIGLKIREYLIKNFMVSGLVKMPSNIFANTGTNVSILFIDKSKKNQTIFLIDATKLGRMIKTDDKNERRFLSKNDEKLIFETFKSKDIISNFSIEVKTEDVIKKNFSLNPGLYFPITITPSNFSKDEIKDKVNVFKKKIIDLRKESTDVSKLIDENLDKIKYE